MGRTMKSIRVVDGVPTVEEGEFVLRDGDVRVKVAAVGICGSDLHLLDAGWAEGRVLGHEISGHLDDGRAVAIEPFRSCGHCQPCTAGDRHACAQGAEVMGIMADGGMAEYMSVPAEALVPLAVGVDIGHASLVENLAVAVHGLNRARLRAGERVRQGDVIADGPATDRGELALDASALAGMGTPAALRYGDNALTPEGARLRADRSERGLVMRFGSRREDDGRPAPMSPASMSPASRSVAEVSEQPVLP